MNGRGKYLTKLYTTGNTLAMLTMAIPSIVRADGEGFISTGEDGTLTFQPSSDLGGGIMNDDTVSNRSSSEIYSAGKLTTSTEETYINIAMGIVVLVLLFAFIRNCVLLAQGSNNTANIERVKSNIAHNLLAIALVGGFWSCFWLFYGLFK